MKVFWIAGEPSGDIQAAALVAALKAAGAEQSGWGGTHMAKAGMTQLYDLPGEPVMGFIEVAKKVPTVVRQLREVKAAISTSRADVVILVDYAGFNLRVAQWASEKGIKVVYFIPPKIWAWKESRIKPLTQYSDLILSILPFEKQWYKKRGVEVHFVGNPLMEKYGNAQGYDRQSKKVLLLPGSRMQEVSRLMPVFIDLAVAMPEYQFEVVRAPSLKERWPQHASSPNLAVVDRSLEEVGKGCYFALTCSGTASLEIALLGIPQAVVYRANPISLAIAKQLVKVKYFSLPNLVLDREVVPEFLQDNVKVSLLKPLIEAGGATQLDSIQELQQVMSTKQISSDAVPLIMRLVNEK